MVKKLHLGCGKVFIPGFFHVDISDYAHIDHRGPVDRLDFIADDSVDLIYASHVLEHFGRQEVESVLTEWRRVLHPAGILRLSVPDIAAVSEVYLKEGFREGYTGLVGLVCGGQRDAYDFHKVIFDEPLLTHFLKKVGFREVRRWDWRRTEHAHIDDFSQAYLPHMDKESGRLMSLNLEALK